jgi:hypothetical protein
MTEEIEKAEQTEPTITLNDFTMMVNIIDVCSKRGSFEGAELNDIGSIRSRLVAFIKYHKPKKEVEPETEPEPEPEEVEKIPEQLEFDFKEEV